MLYRGMDRARLDAAYNNSAAVENYAAIKLDWSRRSARVRDRRRGHFDLAIRSSPKSASRFPGSPRIWPGTVPIRYGFMSPVTLPAAT